MRQYTSRICALLMLGASSVASAAIEVRLRERATASGPLVRLGDVAEIVAADEELSRQIGATLLMPAPAPGTQRFIERREVEDLIAAQSAGHHDLRFTGAAKVSLATAADVSNASDVADSARGTNRYAAALAGRAGEKPVPSINTARAEQLRAEVTRTLEAYLNEKSGRIGEWRVTCEVAERHLALLDTATSPLVCQAGLTPGSGRQRFTVSFHTAQGPVEVPAYAEVDFVSTPVVVAVRPIARGATITAADVELRTLDVLPRVTERRRVLESVEPLIGMEARQSIQAGDVVFSDQLQAPLVVKRGETVTVVSQAGGIRVRTTARARHDGALGELLQLESLDTRQRFDARITGPREVAVFTVARPEKPQAPAWIETARAKKLTLER